MREFLFVFLTIFVITSLIYILYKIMLGASKEDNDKELQITSREIYEQLFILHKQKRYNIVENLAKKYLEQKPNDYGVRSIYAKALYESKKVYDAIEHAKYVISRQPKNSDMRIFLANCYIEIAKPMKAISCVQEILEYEKDNIIAIKELAKLYYDSNQKISAIKMYKRFDEFLDNNLEKAQNKALIAGIHLEFGEIEMAIKEYEEILEIFPEDISVVKRLIELYKESKNYDSAIIAATEILEKSEDSNKLWAMQQLMSIYHITKQYEKALEFADLVKVHPLANEIQVGEEIANILCEEGNIQGSIELLIELIKKDSDNITLKKDLAKAYESNKDFETAIKVYKEILDMASVLDIEKIHSELSNLYSNWALYLFFQNDSAECFRLFTIAIKYDEKNAEVYYKLGNVNKAIKNFNEAVSQYKRAIELDKGNAEYYWEMASCYEEIDSPYEQKKTLIEGLKYDKMNPMVYYKLAVILQSQNDSNGAISNFQKAIGLDGNYIDAKKQLALLHEHLANVGEAIELYEQILEIEPENQEVANSLKMLKDR